MREKESILRKVSPMLLLALFVISLNLDSEVLAGLMFEKDAFNNATFEDDNGGPYTLAELAARGSNTFYIPATQLKVIDASPTFERRYKSPDKFKAVISLNFNPDNDEYAYTDWRVPENFNPATGLTVRFFYYINATSCSVRWIFDYYYVYDGDSDPTLGNTAETSVIVTVPSQAYQIDVISLPVINSTNSGLLPGDILPITIWRHAGSPSDTCNADAKLIGVGFEW